MAICSQPEWVTTFRRGSRTFRYSIRINRLSPDECDVHPEEPVDGALTGTVVRLDHVDDDCDSLLRDDVRDHLTRRFALYLSEYPGVSIFVDGAPRGVSGRDRR